MINKIEIEYLDSFKFKNDQDGGLWPKRVGNLTIKEYEYIDMLKDCDIIINWLILEWYLDDLKNDEQFIQNEEKAKNCPKILRIELSECTKGWSKIINTWISKKRNYFST